MADLETLTLEFRAKTAEAQAQVSALDKKVSGFAASAQKMSAKVSGALSTMAKGFAIGAVVAFGAAVVGAARKSMELADNLKDVADITGASTDALQAWRHGAELNASSAETFDLSLKKLVKSVGEARAGNEAMAGSFRKLGMEDLVKNGASTEEIVTRLADAMRSIKDPAVAAALATDLMGKNAVELIPLLSQGEAGLIAYGKALKESGGHMSREAVKELADLADETKELNRVFDKLAADANIVFLRITSGIVTMVNAMSVQFQRLAVLYTHGLAGVAALDDKRLMDAGAANERKHNQSKHAVRGFTPVAVDTKPPPRNDAADAIKREQEAIKDLLADLDHEYATIGLTNVELAVQNNLRALGASATDAQTTKVEAWTRRNFEAQEALRKVAELEAFAADIRERYGDGTEQLTLKIQMLNDSLAKGLINAQQFGAAMDEALKSGEAKEMEQAWTNIKDQAMSGLADTLVDVATNIDSASERMAAFGEEILKAILKMLLLKAIEEGLNAVFPGAGTATSAVVGGFAAGGTLNPGNAYQLHKNEVVIPHTPVTVLPAGRGGGSTTINYSPTINAQNGVTRNEMQMALAEDKGKFARQVPGLVRESNARGQLKLR